MKFKLPNYLLLLGLMLFFALVGFFLFEFRINREPTVVLWAWERPENLLFLEGRDVGVAFLAGTITFDAAETIISPRRQPLEVNDKTPLIAVVRIESRNSEGGGEISEKQTLQALEFIQRTCLGERFSGCQIDFDAKASERGFYKKLLVQARQKISKTISLSITSLASWCDANSWLDDLPIQEAVPMFFRLGQDESMIRRDLVGKSFMKAEICQQSVGISTDEPLPQSKYLSNRRIYIFNPQAWTKDNFLTIMKLLKEQ